MIEVLVKDVFFDVLSGSGVVLLTDKDSEKVLPIWVGLFEAQSIQMKLKGQHFERPLTYDLFKNVIEEFNYTMEKAEIYDLRGNTYYARIVLKGPRGKEKIIDSRPSDAIALALRFETEIYLSEGLYKTAKTLEDFEKSLKEEFYKKYLETIPDEDLKKT